MAGAEAPGELELLEEDDELLAVEDELLELEGELGDGVEGLDVDCCCSLQPARTSIEMAVASSTLCLPVLTIKAKPLIPC